MLATRARDEEHKAELSPVDIIYEAAINQDAARITAVLSVACIDVQSSADGTAVTKLALEGRHEAVHFLRTRFNASLEWIALGYASGGYVDEANEVLQLAATSADRLNLLQKMASGYARGGYVDEANEVLRLAATSADGRHNVLQEIAYGYARGGHVDAVNEVLKLVETPADRLDLLMQVAYGYARGGYVDAVNEVLKLVEIPADRLDLLEYVESGYSRGGYVDAANEVLKLVEAPSDRLVLLTAMLSGYASVGYVDAANEVLELAPTPADRLVLLREMQGAYAKGGHVNVVNEHLELAKERGDGWLTLALLLDMAFGYAQGRHVSAANEVLELAVATDKFVLLKEMAYGYVLSGHLKAANDVLKRAETEANLRDLSKIIVDNLNRTFFSTEHACLRTLASFSSDFQPFIASESKDFQETLTPLVPRAQKLRRVMNSRELNFNQAIGWTQPEMRIWLLQGVQLVTNNRLTSAIFLSICKYFTPGSASEMIHLSDKLSFTLCPGRFFKNLAGYNHLLTVAPPKNPSAVLDTKKPKPK